MPLARQSHAKHLILTIPTFLLALSGYHLAVDFRSDYLGTDAGEPLALVKSSSGDVKRRASARFRWFDVEDRQSLYPKDSVRTTEHSRVAIRFNDGAKLDVGENSLVVLQKSGEKVSIRLLSGKASVTSGKKPLLVKTNATRGEAVEVTHGELAMAATSGVTHFTVKSGSAVLEQKGKIQSIRSNERLDISPSGEIHVSQAPGTLTEPSPSAVFVAIDHPGEKGATALVNFQWRTSKGWEDPHLELADSADFETINQSIQVSGYTRELSMKPGSYFWRVKGSGPGQLTEVRPLKIVAREPIKLLSPSNEIQALANSEKKMNPVLMSWIGSEAYDRYQVEVSSDPSFKTGVKTIEAKSQNRIIYTPDRPGKFYWRVKPESGDAGQAKAVAAAPPVAPKPLAIATPAQASRPIPLTLISPRPGQEFLPELTANSADRKAKPENRIEFTWKGGTTPKVLLLVWKKSGRTEREVLRQELDNTQASTAAARKFTWVATLPGAYRWKILPLQAKAPGADRKIAMADESILTKAFSFEIKRRFQGIRPYDPLVSGEKVWSNRLLTHLKNNFSVEFRWNALSGARKYKISFYSERMGRKKPIFEKVVAKPELTMAKDILWAAPELSYEIQAFLPGGFVARSALQEFHFEIAPPTPTSPANRARLRLSTVPSSRFALLTWRKTNFTDAYILEFARDRHFKDVLVRKTLTDNYFLQPLEPGKYWWRVRGFSKPFYSQPSKPYELTVR